MSNHIKSEELCARCVYHHYRHCIWKMRGNCAGCEMDATGKLGNCKCLTIEPNTPCPYFVEAEDDE